MLPFTYNLFTIVCVTVLIRYYYYHYHYPHPPPPALSCHAHSWLPDSTLDESCFLTALPTWSWLSCLVKPSYVPLQHDFVVIAVLFTLLSNIAVVNNVVVSQLLVKVVKHGVLCQQCSMAVFSPFVPLIIRIHHFTVPCSWHACVSCYSQWVVACHFPFDVPFPFLRPWLLPMCDVFPVLLYVIVVLVHYRIVLIIISYLHLSCSLSYNPCPSLVSLRSFCCFSSYVVSLGCVFLCDQPKVLLCAQIFPLCARILLLYIYTTQ
jgi:hypothetical protein